ncbi:hypothetical protein [Streptomyces lonarensis]|uniref:Lipoprotein n=1 Tax=Streptomyces lonarensis TaxID=700599 RepID=A0A7X6D5M0_9ACTN|nr:hypothetical protein [Streptomyces lonarensis]NJQ08612.1 hypothetical protein [Streptomyces lonarensis]
MRSPFRRAVVPSAAAVLLLGGCALGGGTPEDDPAEPVRPTTTAGAPDSAVRLADRYREATGDEGVHGIQRTDGPAGVPLLTVWSHHTVSNGTETFERLKNSVTEYLAREEGVDLSEGYLLDVFKPDGDLKHRFDARP